MSSGGLSPEEPATPEIQDLANQAKDKLEEAVNKRFATYEAISFRARVVTGTMFFVKVHYGDQERENFHLKIFEALPVQGGQVDLSGFQEGKTRADPIVPF